MGQTPGECQNSWRVGFASDEQKAPAVMAGMAEFLSQVFIRRRYDISTLNKHNAIAARHGSSKGMRFMSKTEHTC